MVCCAWAAAVICAAAPVPARANFIEQMAVDARAIALANAVTADPPGIAAIHYNPAGLSLLPEGKYFTSGAAVPFIEIESRYDADPEFEGFLGGYNDDPLNHGEGCNSSGRMYVPIVNQEVDFLIAPILGLSYRKPKSRWSFAIGNYVPFGVGFAHDDKNDPVRFGAKYAYLQHLVYFGPAVSYKLTDTLAAGITVGVGQTAMGYSADMRSPNDLVALTRVLGDATKDLEIPVLSELTLPPPWFGGGVGPYDEVASLQLQMRDDFSPNCNLGLLWAPWRWFSMGVAYQSPIKVQFTGTYRFDYTEQFQRMINWMGSSPTLLMVSGMLNLPFNAVPYQEGAVYGELEFPQRVQGGIKLKPFDRISLLADVAWSDWSSVEEDHFTFDQDIQLLQLLKILGYTGGNRDLVLPREFEDTWSYSLGLEVQLTDWFSLLLGYERRPSSVSYHHFDNIYSLPDLDSYGLGFSVKLENGTQIDLGFAYLINEEYTIPNNTSDLMNSTDPFTPVYNPYAGLDYTQKTKTYIASFKLSMPLEVMSEMLASTLSLLNPFDHGKKRSVRVGNAPNPDGDPAAAPGGHAGGREGAAGDLSPGGAYTLELGRCPSAERAHMLDAFYRETGLTPDLGAVSRPDGEIEWVVQIGRFSTIRQAEAFRTFYDLPEAVVRETDRSGLREVRYALRLSLCDNLERARLVAEFYGSEGFAAVVQPVESGYAVLTGNFDSAAQARLFGQQNGLPEADVVPFAD